VAVAKGTAARATVGEEGLQGLARNR